MEIYKEAPEGPVRSVRPVLFHTKVGEEHYFSSHGGSIVLVKQGAHLFGVTCKHVLGGHNASDLTLHFDLSSDDAFKPNFVAAVENGGMKFGNTEIEDILIARWDNFEQFGQAFDDAIDLTTYVDIQVGDVLGVTGFLKNRSDYAVQPAKTFCFQTKMIDIGHCTADPLLRSVEVGLDTNEKEGAAGLSGGLVYNISRQCPAGVIMRGGDIAEHFTLHYLPFDLIQRTIDFIDEIPVGAIA